MSYGMQNSSGLIYNLFVDKLLQLNLVPQEVRAAHAQLYHPPLTSFVSDISNADSLSRKAAR